LQGDLSSDTTTNATQTRIALSVPELFAMRRKPSPKNKSKTISFRVDPVMLVAVDEECSRLGLSRGELVRAIVAVHFEARPARLLERLDALDSVIKRLSKNQVRALVTILMRVGTCSLDEAKEIIRENLLS
jgi:hypothetical protein